MAASRLPFRVTTATGERIDVVFPLHPETGSPMRVSQMLTSVLATLDREVRLDPATSNGDVLQALAMAIAVRTAMIAAPQAVTNELARDLVATALSAIDGAERRHTPAGHA